MVNQVPLHLRHLLRAVTLASCGAALLVSSACATAGWPQYRRWMADYDAAERRMAKTGRDLLIWYQEARPGRRDPLKQVLREPAVRGRIHRYVRCSLLRSFEPDRRYVAQYGVERAPALIVVHADGTYHAITGVMTAEEILEFLDGAQAGGEKPRMNPHVYHEPRYEWRGDYDRARTAAESAGQAVLVVFHRWLSRDWPRLEKLLSRREVTRRLACLVPCKLSSWHRSARALAGEFGVSNMPALVIVHPEGGHHVLELPTSYEAIVRFADDSGVECHPGQP